MSDVVPLKAVDPVSPLADAEVIERLENFLAAAREGRVAAIAIAGVQRDGTLSTGFSWGVVPVSHLLGAMSRLNHKMQNSLDEAYGR